MFEPGHYQRPSAPLRKTGACPYFPEEKRALIAMPSVQRYRIYRTVNNLEWDTPCGARKLRENRELRDEVAGVLGFPDSHGKVSFSRIKKRMGKISAEAQGEFRFNLETKFTALRGDLTASRMRGDLTASRMCGAGRVGAQKWNEWSAQKQDDFVAVILDGGITDEDAHRRLTDEYGLSAQAADECLYARLPPGVADLSAKAARLLAEKMRAECLTQCEAVQAAAAENADFVNPNARARDKELFSELPYYGEVFHGGKYIIPGRREPEYQCDEKAYWGSAAKPSVHIALNQIRRVVNDLIRGCGATPDSIAIEAGRSGYVARTVKDYLAHICPCGRIDIFNGEQTAALRHAWAPDSALSNNGGENQNRDRDHRRRAVDAIVTGATTRSMKQKISAAETDENAVRANIPAPWQMFRKEVKEAVGKIAVSHKPRRKLLRRGATGGKLHRTTAYGVVARDEQTGATKVVHRVNVGAFATGEDLKTIVNGKLRKMFLSAYELARESGARESAKQKGIRARNAIAALAKQKGIRRLRVFKHLRAVIIRGADGEPYKAYQNAGYWCAEIYAFPPGHAQAGEWHGAAVPLFDAHKKGFQPGHTFRPHPAARLVMRLHVNDCVKAEINGKAALWRLQAISSAYLHFAEIHAADEIASHQEEDGALSIKPGSLREMNARKAHISPTGQVRLERQH